MRDSAVTLLGIILPQSAAPSCETMAVGWPARASMISNGTRVVCLEISVVKKEIIKDNKVVLGYRFYQVVRG